jgi:hypothetical protein
MFEKKTNKYMSPSEILQLRTTKKEVAHIALTTWICLKKNVLKKWRRRLLKGGRSSGPAAGSALLRPEGPASPGPRSAAAAPPLPHTMSNTPFVIV